MPRIRKRKQQKYFPKVGDVFGQMTLIRIIRPTGKYRYTRYECKCSCGVVKYATIARLYSGRVISCGCNTKERAVTLGHNNRLKKGNSNENKIIFSYKYAAKKRKLSCSLTKKQFHRLFISNCFYCGISPNRTVKYESCVSEFTFNGIDRVDNKQGYTKNNSVSCCTECNKAKGNMSFEDFVIWTKRLYNHLNN